MNQTLTPDHYLVPPQVVRSFAGVRGRVQRAVQASPQSVNLLDALNQAKSFKVQAITNRRSSGWWWWILKFETLLNYAATEENETTSRKQSSCYARWKAARWSISPQALSLLNDRRPKMWAY